MNIYAYSLPCFKGLLKIGQTKRDVHKRIKEQLSVFPEKNYTLEFSANIENISDKMIHFQLGLNGIENTSGEWFKCSVDDLKYAIKQLMENNICIQYSQSEDANDNILPCRKAVYEKTEDKIIEDKIIEERNRDIDIMLESKIITLNREHFSRHPRHTRTEYEVKLGILSTLPIGAVYYYYHCDYDNYEYIYDYAEYIASKYYNALPNKDDMHILVDFIYLALRYLEDSCLTPYNNVCPDIWCSKYAFEKSLSIASQYSLLGFSL